MDPGLVAEYFLEQTDAVTGQPFLLARLMTAQLQATPVDTSAPGWQRRVSTTLGQAFRADLATVQAAGHRPGDTDPAGLAEALLTALTWGYGAGLPEAEWVTVATATTGVRVGREDISWVLDEVGRYVVEDGEDGVAVYRVAHQSLAEQLRAPFRSTWQEPFDPRALPVTAAVIDRYRELITAGRPAREPRYLWRYTWRHAAAAGPAGLDLLRELADLTADLRPDVALAAGQVSTTLADTGHQVEAVPTAEEAVALYRDLAEADPSFQPNLAEALTNLGNRYSEVGRPAGRGPADRGSRHPAPGAGRAEPRLPARPGGGVDQPRRPVQRGRPPPRRGRPRPRKPSPSTGSRPQQNPAYLPNLAAALNNLGIRYSEVGRPQRRDAPDRGSRHPAPGSRPQHNPAYLPDLAGALNNLGTRYSEVGRRARRDRPDRGSRHPVPGAGRSRTPPTCPTSAMALNNLGNRYSEVGRRARRARPDRGSHHPLPGAGRRQPRLPAQPGGGAEQPRHRLQRGRPAARRRPPDRGSRHPAPGAGRSRTPPTCPTWRWR